VVVPVTMVAGSWARFSRVPGFLTPGLPGRTLAVERRVLVFPAEDPAGHVAGRSVVGLPVPAGPGWS
jgi:hypothetical protein